MEKVHFELDGSVNLEVGLAGEDVTAYVVGFEVEGGQEALKPELRYYLALLVATFELIKWTKSKLLRFRLRSTGAKAAAGCRTLAPREGIQICVATEALVDILSKHTVGVVHVCFDAF